MPKVFLNLGSNIEREHNINSGLKSLKEAFGILQVSSIYESEPVGFDGSCFYNMAASFQTDMTLSEVTVILKSIEDRHGRTRGEKHFAPRTLDIDVVCYGNLIGKHDGVELPRPELYYNAFVLWPMAELAPLDLDIKTGLNYQSLWQQNQDEIVSKQKVWIVSKEQSLKVLEF